MASTERSHSKREEGDFTSEDTMQEQSELLKFYKNSTILITGATGYLGKLTMEKLLRTCDVKKIYIIIRPKKDKDPEKRFEELFDEPSFEPLKKQDKNFAKKIHMMTGDAILPNLGLSRENMEIIKSEVNVVFHYAATVRFDEKLRIATYINVRGVRDLLNIARDAKNLKAFIHVSTAYSNCVHKTIEEKFYEPPISSEKLILLVNCLDDIRLEAITNTLIGNYPNTYAFTKCIAEDVIRREGRTMPVGLFRPSIVIATVREPVAGWINNVYGATGVMLGVAIGLLRTLHGNSKNYADLVPADYVVNGAITSAWDVACSNRINENNETNEIENVNTLDDKIPVYNYVSTPEKPISWDEFQKLSTKHCKKIPSEKCIWHSYFRMRQNKWVYLISLFLLHTVPSYIVDFIAMCLGKKPILVKSYEKINKFANVLSYFCLNQWNFTNNNVQSMWNKLNTQDKQLFEFSMKQLDWDLYFSTYTKGGRLYIIKDPLNTIPKGRVKYMKLFVAHYTLVAILAALFIKIVMTLFNYFFS